MEGNRKMEINPKETDTYKQQCGTEILRNCANVQICQICCEGRCYIVNKEKAIVYELIASILLGLLFIASLIINIIGFWYFTRRTKLNKHSKSEVNHCK